MPIDPNIPLGFKPTEYGFMTPFQLAGGGNSIMMQQATIKEQILNATLKNQQIQTGENELKTQMLLSQLASQPGNIDSSTGQWTNEGLQKIPDPLLRQRLIQKSAAMDLERARVGLETSKTTLENKKIFTEQMDSVQLNARAAYESTFEKTGGDVKASNQAFEQAQSEGYEQLKESGLIPSNNQLKPLTYDVSYRIAAARSGKSKEIPEEKIIDRIATLQEEASHMPEGSPQAAQMLKKAKELQALIPVNNGENGKPPAGYRWTKDGKLEFIPGGPADPNTKEFKLANRDKTGEGKAPSGYRWTKDGTLEFIPGGPADPSAKEGKLGMHEQIYVTRVATSAAEAARDLENVVRLPISASSGILGQLAGQHAASVYGAGRNALAQTLSPQEIQSYNVLSSGFQRSLAGIESAGLAPPGSLSNQMDAVIFRPGDTQFTKLQKLAQTRQIIEAGLEVQASNPRIPEMQRNQMQETIDKIKKSVPFSQQDLINLQEAQEKDKNVTLEQVMKQKKKKYDSDDNSEKSSKKDFSHLYKGNK